MAIYTQTFSSAFHRSVTLLLQLHRVMTTGDPDGEVADRVRDEMEAPWHAMNESEQEIIRGLSSDLYSIGRERTTGPEVQSELVHLAMDALKKGQCERLLQILREHESVLPPDSVAFLRGMAWSLFDEYEVAVEFFQEATRLSNFQWPPFLHALLTALIAAGKSEQACEVVERITCKSDDPLILLDAAEAYFVRSTEVDFEESKWIQQKAVETANRALAIAERSEPNAALISQRALIQLWLALFHMSSGDTEAARQAADVADSLARDDPNVEFLKQIITQRSDRESWDRGIGKVMVRLRGLSPGIPRLPLDLVAAN